jgi:hypothetical protein
VWTYWLYCIKNTVLCILINHDTYWFIICY